MMSTQFWCLSLSRTFTFTTSPFPRSGRDIQIASTQRMSRNAVRSNSQVVWLLWEFRIFSSLVGNATCDRAYFTGSMPTPIDICVIWREFVSFFAASSNSFTGRITFPRQDIDPRTDSSQMLRINTPSMQAVRAAVAIFATIMALVIYMSVTILSAPLWKRLYNFVVHPSVGWPEVGSGYIKLPVSCSWIYMSGPVPTAIFLRLYSVPKFCWETRISKFVRHVINSITPSTGGVSHSSRS
jgi:hypothetical protein